MIHLKSVSLPDTPGLPNTFPFNVPVIQALKTLEFTQDVTFFVGENGSGKSTLLEAMACAAQLPTVGSDNIDDDATLKEMRALSQRMKWAWTKRTRKGFFMRSEDFFGFAKRMTRMKADLEDELKEIQQEFSGKNKSALGLASMPFGNELAAIKHFYGDGLDAQSHGESYFKLFRARFIPGGLYLLDEPEAPLSPMRQLAFMALMRQMIRQNAQFIIATHSPILLAYPGATILQFEGQTIKPTAYEALEHVTITRTFLNHPETYLRHLFDDEV